MSFGDAVAMSDVAQQVREGDPLLLRFCPGLSIIHWRHCRRLEVCPECGREIWRIICRIIRGTPAGWGCQGTSCGPIVGGEVWLTRVLPFFWITFQVMMDPQRWVVLAHCVRSGGTCGTGDHGMDGYTHTGWSGLDVGGWRLASRTILTPARSQRSYAASRPSP